MSTVMSKRVPVSRRDVSELLYFQKNRCKVCEGVLEKNCVDIDHIIPRSICMDDRLRNLQALCLNCHRKKTIAELPKIKRFNKFKGSDTPICWYCEQHVSPYWYVFPVSCGGCSNRSKHI